MAGVDSRAEREGAKRCAGAGPNAVLYLPKRVDWKLQVTTPNNATLDIKSIGNAQKGGPLVIEIPPTTEDVGLFGTAMDAWQRPLIDVGGQGYDKGLGAKYLFLPPGYQDVPPTGYVPIHSPSNNGWFLLRTLLKNLNQESLEKGVKFIKQIKVYPLSKADNPPATKHVDGSGILIHGIATYNDTVFDALNTRVQEEPVAEQDMVPMAMLKTIGIEKGKSFKPTKKKRSPAKLSQNSSP